MAEADPNLQRNILIAEGRVGNTSISLTTLRSNSVCIDASDAHAVKYAFTINTPPSLNCTSKERHELYKLFLAGHNLGVAFLSKDALFSPTAIEDLEMPERSSADFFLTRSREHRIGSFKTFPDGQKVWTTICASNQDEPFDNSDADEGAAGQIQYVGTFPCTVSVELNNFTTIREVNDILNNPARIPTPSITDPFFDFLENIMRGRGINNQETARDDVAVRGKKFFDFSPAAAWTGYGVELRKGISAECRLVNRRVIRVMTPCLQLFHATLNLTTYVDILRTEMELPWEDIEDILRQLKVSKANEETRTPLNIVGVAEETPENIRFYADGLGNVSVQEYFEIGKGAHLSDACRSQRCVIVGSIEHPKFLPTQVCKIVFGQAFSGPLPVSGPSQVMAETSRKYYESYPDPKDRSLKTLLSRITNEASLIDFGFSLSTGQTHSSNAFPMRDILDCNELRRPKAPKASQKDVLLLPASMIVVLFGATMDQETRQQHSEVLKGSQFANGTARTNDGGKNNAAKIVITELEIENILRDLLGPRCESRIVFVADSESDYQHVLEQCLVGDPQKSRSIRGGSSESGSSSRGSSDRGALHSISSRELSPEFGTVTSSLIPILHARVALQRQRLAVFLKPWEDIHNFLKAKMMGGQQSPISSQFPGSDKEIDMRASRGSFLPSFVLGLWINGATDQIKSAQLKRLGDVHGCCTASLAINISKSTTGREECSVDNREAVDRKLDTLSNKIQAKWSKAGMVFSRSNLTLIGVHVVRIPKASEILKARKSGTPGDQTTKMVDQEKLMADDIIDGDSVLYANSMEAPWCQTEGTAEGHDKFRKEWFLVSITSKRAGSSGSYKASTYCQQGFSNGAHLGNLFIRHFGQILPTNQHLVVYRSGFAKSSRYSSNERRIYQDPYLTEFEDLKRFIGGYRQLQVSFVIVNPRSGDYLFHSNTEHRTATPQSVPNGNRSRKGAAPSTDVVTHFTTSDVFHTGSRTWLMQKTLREISTGQSKANERRPSKSNGSGDVPDHSPPAGCAIALTEYGHYPDPEVPTTLTMQVKAAYEAAWDYPRGVFNSKLPAPSHFARLASKRALSYVRLVYGTDTGNKRYFPDDFQTRDDDEDENSDDEIFSNPPDSIALPRIHESLKNTLYYI